jgi:succinate-acetate transporter protein
VTATLTSGEREAREERERRVEATTRVVLRPIASPAALGFLGLAGATFVLAGLQLGWVEPAEGKNVALVLMAFTVPLQFLAGVLGFLARDGVVGTGMGLLSGIWLTIGLTLWTSPPGSQSDALGLFLVLAAVAMWVPATSGAVAKVVPAAVLATAGVRFLVTGVFQLTSNKAWEDTAGVLGLVLAALAVYAAFAAEVEDTQKRTILPMLRRGEGKLAIEAPTLVEQASELHHEPGVRKQL